nr:Hint domain-containing protein [Marivita sp. GX14005]
MIISELLVDNPSAGGTDVDGDGTANKSDEFIEIQNTTGAPVSLNGFELWSEKSGLLYSFGASDTVAAGGTATVVGEYTGSMPAGFYEAGVSDGANWLADGEGSKFDSIFLVDTNTGEYVVLSYGQPPQAPTLPGGFPGTTRMGAGESLDSGAPNGVAFARNANGNFTETAPSPGTSGVPCYAEGTMIQTTFGPRAVESLCPGDMVTTLDNGPQPVIWTRRDVQPLDTVDAQARPVLISRDSLGPGLPMRALVVSPQHRILIGGRGQMDHALDGEYLVPAKALVGCPGIRFMNGKRKITWVHIAFARHEVINSNGCLAESLLFGPMVLQGLGRVQRKTVAAAFGLRCDRLELLAGLPARPLLTVRAARGALRPPQPSARSQVRPRPIKTERWDKP